MSLQATSSSEMLGVYTHNVSRLQKHRVWGYVVNYLSTKVRDYVVSVKLSGPMFCALVIKVPLRLHFSIVNASGT